MKLRKSMRSMSLAAWVVAVGALLLTGCGPDKKIEERESSNLKPLAVYYGRFVGAHRGQPPANEQELKEFIRSRPATELEALGVKDVDSLFISARDKKPYRFVAHPSMKPGQGINVFVYEEQGIGGKRYVGGTLGQIEEVDEARFKELVPDAK
jgi:hypothetical protein